MTASVPLQPVTGRAADMLKSYGAGVSDLYRAMANNPEVLEAWLGMAWGLRTRARTPRALREIMILRSAHVQGAMYQWTDHTVMARNAGVPETQIEGIATWATSDAFSAPERLVLALTDEMLNGRVSDDVLAALEEEFDAAERVELFVTAGFYCMVPRVLNALRLES